MIFHWRIFSLLLLNVCFSIVHFVNKIFQVTVWKRYNDFKKLYKALHTTHQNLHLKGTFPTFAKARFFGKLS